MIKSATPKVTVITVVRNGREFIGQTIESVLEQTYREVEYVVVDGASSDGTVDIVRSYERGLARWISEPDAGIADAFNKGIAMATGEYLLFLNADDKLSGPDAIATLVAKAVENGLPMLVFGDVLMISRDTAAPAYLHRMRRKRSSFSLSRGDTLPHPSLLFHRKYFEKYGLYDTSFRIAMDYELLLRGALREPIVHVPAVISLMREGGLSGQDRQAVVNETIRALRKNGMIRGPFGEIRLRSYFAGRLLAKKLLQRLQLYDRIFRLQRS